MALVIRRTGSVDYGRFIKTLIVGPPGSGKTLLSSTYPEPFFASAEGGMMSIAKMGLPYTNIESIDQLFQLKKVLGESPKEIDRLLGAPVKTIIIDTVDEIQRIMIRERLDSKHAENIELKDWQYFGDVMAEIVRGFRNLDMNVVFTCHIKEAQEGDGGRTYFKPQLQGGFVDQMPAAVDLSLLLKEKLVAVQGEKGVEYKTVRTLQTFKDNQHDWIKDRSGKLPREFEVNFQDDYQRMYDTIFDGMEDLPEWEERTVEVEMPPPIAPRPPDKAVNARRQVARPVATSSGRPARPVVPGLTQPTVESPQQTLAVDEAPDLSSFNFVASETEIVTPEGTEVEIKNSNVKICNPEKHMPGTDIVLHPLEHGTDIYCQSCGNELENVEQSQFSIMRHRSVLCVPCFNNENNKRKTKETVNG